MIQGNEEKPIKEQKVYCSLCERSYKNYERFKIHMLNQNHYGCKTLTQKELTLKDNV